MSLNEADEILKQTSRTFYPSIASLPDGIREAVMSSYLSLRAVDEIEDHDKLVKDTKVNLLRAVSDGLRDLPTRTFRCAPILKPYRDHLPEVTLRIDEWLALCPKAVLQNVKSATAVMAERMARWVSIDWLIKSKKDLDQYTFDVAGSVGVLLSELWIWHDRTPSRRADAISYGRGLQAVNILRNRTEDLSRGVDFFPRGWNERDLFRYARTTLSLGDEYVNRFSVDGVAHTFCRAPQTLAYATLDALERGESKLSRDEVVRILKPMTQPKSGQDFPEKVVLVNQLDEAIGTDEKITAHVDGKLHRAFSVFIVNSANQLLLQRRTATKYHSRGLWSNTCCGHPRPNECIEQASQRRLREEMGFDSKLTKLFDFVYRAELEDGLIEHEYDHVLIGRFDGIPLPNASEVSEWRWIDLEILNTELLSDPDGYTYWFRISFGRFLEKFQRAPTNVK